MEGMDAMEGWWMDGRDGRMGMEEDRMDGWTKGGSSDVSGARCQSVRTEFLGRQSFSRSVWSPHILWPRLMRSSSCLVLQVSTQWKRYDFLKMTSTSSLTTKAVSSRVPTQFVICIVAISLCVFLRLVSCKPSSFARSFHCRAWDIFGRQAALRVIAVNKKPLGEMLKFTLSVQNRLEDRLSQICFVNKHVGVCDMYQLLWPTSQAELTPFFIAWDTGCVHHNWVVQRKAGFQTCFFAIEDVGVIY